MIMMPKKATLSRIFAGPTGLLSRTWSRVILSAGGSPRSERAAEYSRFAITQPREETGSQSTLPSSAQMPSDLPASLEALAEQMLGIVEIVSVQERTIQTLRQRCQKLEDHDQAIMVAFTTFFHVLAAGHVAKIEDIAGILNNITDIAEREERPSDAIAFLRDLTRMLPEQSSGTATSARSTAPGADD